MSIGLGTSVPAHASHARVPPARLRTTRPRDKRPHAARPDGPFLRMFLSVNGYFFIPTYGSLIAAINFDLSGTTKIGKYILNHSFMISGLVATATTVSVGLVLAKAMF